MKNIAICFSRFSRSLLPVKKSEWRFKQFANRSLCLLFIVKGWLGLWRPYSRKSSQLWRDELEPVAVKAKQAVELMD